jgi:rhodanese-related sulfurtransferase
VRDLGGLRIEGDGETRFGVAVRADSIRALSDEGWRALVDYGVRLAVDLRSDDDLADDPPGDVPIEVVRFPISGDDLPEVREWASMQEAYAAILAAFPEAFAGAATAVACADGPVVIHCQGGRDRTGLACALMLRLAGVALDEVTADHTLSDDNLRPTLDSWLASAPDEAARARRLRVTTAPGRAMAEVLQDVDARDYLLAAGATTDVLDTLVVRLRPWS